MAHPAFLKRLLVLAWAVWLTVVLATNLCDGCKALGLLPEAWRFASGNYAFLAQTTAIYATPPWLDAVLFSGVMAWEGLAAVLFWRAWAGFRPGDEGSRRRVYTACAAGVSLWAAFAVADEVFLAYAVEATHWRLFVAQLVTLLAVELLPDEVQRRV